MMRTQTQHLDGFKEPILVCFEALIIGPMFRFVVNALEIPFNVFWGEFCNIKACLVHFQYFIEKGEPKWGGYH